jgi:hypothetical protein
MFATLAMRAANGQKEPPDEGTTTDIDTVAQKLLAYLKSIRNSITAEHVAAIREVYGDNHLAGVPAAQ